MSATTAMPLVYTFTPSLYPLLASVSGAPQTQADLQVMISNPNLDPAVIVLQEIQITIPIGEDSARSLSTDALLPPPSQVTVSSGWKITTGVQGVVRVVAAQPSRADEPISFVLQALKIPVTPGSAPIIIAEYASAGGQPVEQPNAMVVKLPNDYPVRSCTATPANPGDVGPMTLHWMCNPHCAVPTSYAARGVSAHQSWGNNTDCTMHGTCLDCSAGVSGVSTSPTEWDETATFYLDLIQKQGSNLVVVDSLTVTATLFLPVISQYSYMYPILGGQLLLLHWQIESAASCDLSLDGNTILTGLPLDTYHTGYPLVLANTGAHQVVLTAYGQGAQSARTSFTFGGSFAVTGPARVATGLTSWSGGATLGITPDSRTAFLLNRANQAVPIPLRGPPPTASPLLSCSVNAQSMCAALATDGKQVVFLTEPLDASQMFQNNLHFVDIASGKETVTVPLPNDVLNLTATPDGSLVLVSGAGGEMGTGSPRNVSAITLYDMKQHTNVTDDQPWQWQTRMLATAIHSDGDLVVCLDADAYVWFYSIKKRAPTSVAFIIPNTTIRNGFGWGGIALSPDGNTAVAVSQSNNVAAIVDVPNQRLCCVVPLRSEPNQVAILQDSRFALVATSNGIQVIDLSLPTPAVVYGTLPCAASALLVSPDGQTVIATGSDNSSVLVFNDRRSKQQS